MTQEMLHLDDLPGYDPVPLPFSWRELPRRPCEPGGYPAISAGAHWTVKLLDGREAELTALHQYATYAGVLAGVPNSDEVRAWPIEGAVRLASDLFLCEPRRVALLAPELWVSTVVSSSGQGSSSQVVEFLPPVCSIATFESEDPVNDAAADGSEIVVVWFQGVFGPPEAGYVTECLRRVEWEEFAGDLHLLDL
jgi:hypothetical protein